jgi:hypothetical protein
MPRVLPRLLQIFQHYQRLVYTYWYWKCVEFQRRVLKRVQQCQASLCWIESVCSISRVKLYRLMQRRVRGKARSKFQVPSQTVASPHYPRLIGKQNRVPAFPSTYFQISRVIIDRDSSLELLLLPDRFKSYST